MTATAKLPVVVGVDGSPPAIDALRWAVAQAEQTGAPVRAVTAWTFPDEPTPFGIVPDLPPRPDQLALVRAKLEAVVAEAARTACILVQAEVIRGRAAAVLVESARDAALLVVGSRGRGALAEALLGSVSEYCVRHAPCPVVVVRGAVQRSWPRWDAPSQVSAASTPVAPPLKACWPCSMFSGWVPRLTSDDTWASAAIRDSSFAAPRRGDRAGRRVLF
jgi:nucleotide-binding universal stress UspA family protein